MPSTRKTIFTQDEINQIQFTMMHLISSASQFNTENVPCYIRHNTPNHFHIDTAIFEGVKCFAIVVDVRITEDGVCVEFKTTVDFGKSDELSFNDDLGVYVTSGDVVKAIGDGAAYKLSLFKNKV